ncbi:MAG: arginyl-tRNA synthetase [Clostridia bacterium]|jgi:arginyl-tRNA synthetase|nr:arginyl-tRNA synthetase [Clostridia bacterium]
MDFKKEVANKISQLVDMELEKVMELIEIPPQSNMGDYAFPCFQLAKTMRKAPNMIAADLAGKFTTDNVVGKVEAAGGYLNFFVNKGEFIKTVLTEVLAKGKDFGTSTEGNGKTVLVEFSSPNIAKPFHIGHLVNTLTGSAIEKIYRHLGYETQRLNHIGDYGTNFGKQIAAFKHWGDEEALEKEPINELLRVYIKFHEEVENNPSLETEARQLFKKLEDGDPEMVGLWQKFRDLSIVEFKKLYEEFNIEFDSYNGESFYTDKMGEVVQMLRDKGLLVESNGAQIVDLEKFNMPPCLILKSDGATIYATRDLAAALYRYRTYDFHKCLYVVGNTQALHFKQIFTVLKLMGFEWAENMSFVGTSLVKFADRKLATRSGDIIYAKGVLDEAAEKTLEIVETKNSNLANKEDVAKKVGMGAVAYTILKNNKDKDIIFSWEDILSFEGDSGPYVQYTCVRGKSVLRKAGEMPATADYSTLVTDEEFMLAKLLDGFKSALKEAAERYEPFVITRQVTEIAKAYNKFYNSHPIMNAEPELKAARLHLTKSVCNVIETGLGMIGIEVPENM